MRYALAFLLILIASGCTQSILFDCRKDPNYKYCPDYRK